MNSHRICKLPCIHDKYFSRCQDAALSCSRVVVDKVGRSVWPKDVDKHLVNEFVFAPSKTEISLG